MCGSSTELGRAWRVHRGVLPKPERSCRISMTAETQNRKRAAWACGSEAQGGYREAKEARRRGREGRKSECFMVCGEQRTPCRCPTPRRRAREAYGSCLPPPACCGILHRHLRGFAVFGHGVVRRARGLQLRGTGPDLAQSPLTTLPSALTTASASRLHLFEARYPAHL